MTALDPTPALPSTDGLSLLPDDWEEGGGGPTSGEARVGAQRAGTRTRTRSIRPRTGLADTPVTPSVTPQVTPRTGLWRARPSSLASLHAYTRAGGWMPGEQPLPLEAAGMAYGWLIALPVTAVLYGLAWIVQRPSRAAVTALLALVWWLTA